MTAHDRGDDAATSMPDPSDVFTLPDLCRHLARLRERGPGSRSTPKVGLTRLARLTSIPRSTLHTYVSGQTFPPADALDAIVLALGCTPLQARAWADAWERVAETTRGGLLPSRSPYWARLQRIDRGVSDFVAATLRCRREDFEAVAIAERAVVGADRLIRHVDMRMTVRARRDGVARWTVYVPASEDNPHPELIDATALYQCVIGSSHFVPAQASAVVEVLLGEALDEGEVHTFEFRLHHEHAQTRALQAWGTRPPQLSTDVRRGFARQGSSYTLEVEFEATRPAAVHQCYQSGPDAPVDLVRPLRLTSWGTTTVALGRPVAGMHGIVWTWPVSS